MALRRLDRLVAAGAALLEARTNPAEGGKKFPDFGEAYRRWYIACKDLIAALSGPSAAGEWSAGQCRGMYSLDQGEKFVLKEQERQQGMLVELREELRADLGSSAGPVESESAPLAGKAAEQAVAGPEKGGAPSARAGEDPGRLYALKPEARDLTDEQLLEDLRLTAKALGKRAIGRDEYKLQGRLSWKTYVRRFGSWNNAVTAAGLAVVARKNIPTEALYENLARVWQAVGRQPVESDMVRPQSEYSSGPYRSRFGSWRDARKAFVAWAKGGETPEASSVAPYRGSPENSREPSARLRFAVLERDSFTCTACGRSPGNEKGVKLHLDHKIPWSRGGRTTWDNLTTLCEKCNLGKGDL